MSDIALKNTLEAVKAGVFSAGQATRDINVPETTLRWHLMKLGIVPPVVSIIYFFALLVTNFCTLLTVILINL